MFIRSLPVDRYEHNILIFLSRCNHFIRHYTIVFIFFTFYLAGSSHLFASFELIGLQTRHQGMGGTVAAHSMDAGTLLGNPAGLAQIASFQASVDYANLYGMRELNAAFFTTAIPTRFGTVGIGNSGFGNKLYREQTFAAGYAGSFGQSVWWGMAARYNYLSIEKYGSAGTVAIDAGLVARLTGRLHLGMLIRNINRAYIGQARDPLPHFLATGISYQPIPSLLLAMDVQKEVRSPVSIHAGAEFSLLKRLFLRAGFMTRPDHITFGCAFQFSRFIAGYAALLHHELGLTNQFSLSFAALPKHRQSGPISQVRTESIAVKQPVKVHINTATVEQLQQLKGVGPTLARRIVQYRRANGPFRSPDDLKRVKGIGNQLISRNKNRIVID